MKLQGEKMNNITIDRTLKAARSEQDGVFNLN